MRVKKLNSDKEVLLSFKKYKIDWENSGASKLERQFRDLIYPYWKNQIVLYQCFVPGSKLRLDFLNCNKRLCVEIDGKQHGTYVKFFHNNNRLNWMMAWKRDEDKQKWLEDNNIKFLALKQEDLDYFSPKYILEKFGINII